MLRVEAIDFSWPGGGSASGDRRTLRGVSLEAEPGRVFCLVGPNGAGKTTLLRCVLRLLTPSAGRVTIAGRDVAALSRMELARLVAYVPQASHGRFPATIYETVLCGRRPQLGWRPSARDHAVVSGALARLGLSELAQRDVDRVSGGQRQKALVARALAQETPWIVLDEPTSSLDVRRQLEIMELMRELSRERGVGIVMAMHDLNLVRRYADRAGLLRDGAMREVGPPGEVLRPETVAEAYGVEVVEMTGGGHAGLLPVRPL